jgi:hypothetical protein
MNLLTLFQSKRRLPERVANLAVHRRKAVRSLQYSRYEWYTYESRSGLYRYLRDRVPIISSAIWHWVRLCNTPGMYYLIGKESYRQEAEDALSKLFERIGTVIGLKRTGIGSLLELFFQEVFTNGSFSGRLVPLPSGSGIDYFEDIDQSDIEWEKAGRWTPYIKRGEQRERIEEHLFFHYGLGADRYHPEGVSFLASVEFVTEIEQRMVEDMARSGHNAGNPHLHVKISPPEQFEAESDAKYVKRAEKYFDDTVNLFREINPEDNIFTWSDIEISIIGGQRSMSYSWRVNREQVIEDVITGMKLFPWVVGRSHGTTKNWVQAQFNLLMQVVDSIQEEGKAIAEWVLNTELRLRGIPVRAVFIFSPNQDPYQLERERAAAIRFETIDKKVRSGYISKDDGAKELGYERAYKVNAETPAGI